MRIESHHSGTGSGSAPDRNIHVTDHHDYKDIRFGAVNKFLYWLFAMVIVSYFAMYAIYVMVDSGFQASDPAPPPTAQVEFTTPPVDIQPAPHYELVQHEEAIDEATAAALQSGERVSIEEAIDATLSEGLPYRASAENSERAVEGSSGAEDEESASEDQE